MTIQSIPCPQCTPPSHWEAWGENVKPGDAGIVK